MFAGHFGLAAIVKAKERSVPLWVLLVASQLLDIIFIPLYFLGIESLQKIGSGGYGEQIIHANYTHSLFGALLISFVAGVLARKKWSKKAGYLVAGMVFSHWLLDLLVHRMDMPLLPGNIDNLPLLGFGLWQHKIISILAETILIIAGIILYSKQTNAASDLPKEKKRNNIIFVAIFLLLILLSSFIGF